MKRGIVNVGGTSCHLSCVLQILCHVVVPFRDVLIHQYLLSLQQQQQQQQQQPSSSLSSSSSLDAVASIGKLFHQLLSTATTTDSDDAIDPTQTFECICGLADNLDYRNVDDASTVLTKVLELCNASPLQDWMTSLFFSGSQQQTITGRRGATTHQKVGKFKPSAVPYVLRFTDASSIAQSLRQTEQVVHNYKWPVEAQDDAVEGEWTTTRSVVVKTVPPYFFLHLERFTYRDGERCHVANTEFIQIDTEITMVNDSSYTLQAGIVHVAEDSIAEEGHYIALVKETAGRTTGGNGDNDDTWHALNDETCTRLSQDEALGQLGGVTNDEGHYFCATLLLYVRHNMEDTIQDQTDALKEVMTTHATTRQDNETKANSELIGKRLRVRWAKGKFYAGVVSQYHPETGKHTVTYDDGDIKKYNLSKKTIEWLD